jgi:hypothetical protein
MLGLRLRLRLRLRMAVINHFDEFKNSAFKELFEQEIKNKK